MKLSELLRGIPHQTALPDCEVSDVCSDSRKITPGCVFVCIKGENFDGHSHAAEAVQAGAAAVVCEQPVGLSCEIAVENTRLVYAKMCAALCGHPEQRMTFVGVTGTNGKTTTTNLIKSILTREGHKVGLIGTIRNEIGDEVVHAHRTTPDAYELYNLFARMADSGCDTVVMEVSSHALHQYRLGEVPFEIGVFTNLTQDHLDYHKTMEAYFEAKKMLFQMTKKSIVNFDDPYGQRLIGELSCPSFRFSAKEPDVEYYAAAPRYSASSVHYTLRRSGGEYPVDFKMPGSFSVLNSLAAAAVCIELGVSPEKAAFHLCEIEGVKGRSEVIPTGKDFTIVCDYAHSPDGLDNILPTLKQNAGGRLVTLFGCGGDRDRTKRPLMGESAARFSDFVIVTSDNPRTEDPGKIIDDILPGVRKYETPYVVIPDRREAIYYAVSHAQKDDLIVLAGKGHEDYQVIGEEEIHFDEREIVAEAIARL